MKRVVEAHHVARLNVFVQIFDTMCFDGVGSILALLFAKAFECHCCLREPKEFYTFGAEGE